VRAQPRELLNEVAAFQDKFRNMGEAGYSDYHHQFQFHDRENVIE
jgi:hypothetical protein